MRQDSEKRDTQHQEIVSGMSTLTNALNEVKTGLATEVKERKAETKELREQIAIVKKRDQTVIENMVQKSLETNKMQVIKQMQVSMMQKFASGRLLSVDWESLMKRKT